MNAAGRISVQFFELLDSQFPVGNGKLPIALRYPAAFAGKLNVHVNHLCHALKQTTGYPTTHWISIRILEESKRLLRETPLSFDEISMALGFKETTHFHNFFKKHTGVSCKNFRMGI